MTKLRGWFLRGPASDGDDLTPEAAAYVVEMVLAEIPSVSRAGAARELTDLLGSIFDRHDTPHPVWLATVRDRHD